MHERCVGQWKLGLELNKPAEIMRAEVIEKLQEVATNLPNGLDTEVEIQICNGHDAPGLRTTSVEVNAVWMIDEEMAAERAAQIEDELEADGRPRARDRQEGIA